MKKFIASFISPVYLTKSGFSLIELLVVMLIMGVLLTIGLTSYNNYAKSQMVRNAALELKNDLRFAQNQALSGVKYESCGSNPMVGWYVRLVVGASNYTINVRCSGTTGIIKKTVKLPDGVTVKSISAGQDIMFKPLSGVVFTSNANVDSPTPVPGVTSVYVDLTSGSIDFRVTVIDTGEVYETKL